MNDENAGSHALQPLSLEDVAGIIGGALAAGPDISDTGPSTGGSGNASPNVGVQIGLPKAMPDVSVQAAE